MWQRVWTWERSLKTGKTYCLRWYDERRRIRTEAVGSDRRLAERRRQEREHELNYGMKQSVPEVSYDQFVKEELEVMKGRLSANSLEHLERTLQAFAGVCSVQRMRDVTPRAVEQYFSHRLKSVRVATANKDLRVLKASFGRAVRRGYMCANPVTPVKPVREPERSIRILSPEEVATLLSACPSLKWRVLIGLAVNTGMRVGEMLALHWEDVDSAGGTILIRNSQHHLTKSRRNRVVALIPELCRLLNRLPRKGALIFQTPDGRPIRNNLQRDFRRIVKRAGLKACTMHDLRRTFVSYLAMAGVNEAIVQKLAGHASINTTLRYYTNIMPEALRVAQARLPFGAVLRTISYSYHGSSEPPTRKTAQIASAVTA